MNIRQQILAINILALAVASSAMADSNANDNNTSLACGEMFTPIHAVQGSGSSSPIAGQRVEVEGLVTADYQEDLSGFYLQSSMQDVDSYTETSEGVFVHTGNTIHPLSVGNRIRISADVSEANEVTQLENVSGLTVCVQSDELPSASPLTLPFATPPEHLEGMLVSFNNLTVNDVYHLGRFGTVTLANGRRFIPTQIASPGAEANAVIAANASNKIVLDDGSNKQNPNVIPFPSGGLSAQNSLRVGDVVSMPLAVLHFAFGDYRIQPLSDLVVEQANSRTQAPELSASGNAKIASFNVLNYFTSLEERGADSEAELLRQEAKLVSALNALDADVIGLMEIENNGFDGNSAIARLTSALDNADAAHTWAFITPEVPRLGTGSIAVGIIYRSSVLTPVAAASVLDSSNSVKDNDGQPLFLESKNRPALAQEFSLNANGANFVVSVNHFKSKGSSCEDINDPNLHDGQGNCNLTRTRAAQALATWLNTTYADKPIMIIGDLNAYVKEDPVTALIDAGYTELFEHLGKENAYSYVFSGASGQLDHALANAKMLSSVVDATEWHINADEPIVLDYNLEFKTEAQQTSYYSADPYRASDHDPVIIAVNLEPASSADNANNGSVQSNNNANTENSNGGGSIPASMLIILALVCVQKRRSHKPL